MPLKLVTPPAERPVSLAEARLHLRVDHTDEDDLIAGLLDAAVDHLDGASGILGRALVTQAWDLVLDALPCDAIQLPLAPLVSVSSVQYYDTAGALQTLSPSLYYVDAISQPGWVTRLSTATWPDTMDGANAVIVRFVAGYGAAAAVPGAIKAAIKLLVGHLYRNREATTAEALTATPMAVDALLAPYRIIQF